jgi:hypothetical protein
MSLLCCAPDFSGGLLLWGALDGARGALFGAILWAGFASFAGVAGFSAVALGGATVAATAAGAVSAGVAAAGFKSASGAVTRGGGAATAALSAEAEPLSFFTAIAPPMPSTISAAIDAATITPTPVRLTGIGV